MRVVAIIPARLQSSRLANKIILDISGKTMIQRVYEQVLKTKNLSGIYIATDSSEISDICKGFTENIIMTSSSHRSGTDRITEAIKKIDCEGVVNVQGDEPLVDPQLIDDLADGLKQKKASVLSAMHRIAEISDLTDPSNVKVIVDEHNMALYFSRSIIPYPRNDWNTLKSKKVIPDEYLFFKHIGIYAYSTDLLKKVSSWSQTPLEKMEQLEQLRIIEHGYKIQMLLTDYESIGVDTADDLEKVRLIVSKYEK